THLLDYYENIKCHVKLGLRHWVIARLISHGTRTPEGSHTLGVLASVIETCRVRGISPWPYLASVIAAGRCGKEISPLPLPMVA
ncbi:MAG: hypothetical protein HQL84_17780, partial [Magnetococcales bacterium]|nr:hypothetical protein [Magnetococcales bacterium]